MACQSCTRDELCIACRFEGREQRLPRYAGRRSCAATTRPRSTTLPRRRTGNGAGVCQSARWLITNRLDAQAFAPGHVSPETRAMDNAEMERGAVKTAAKSLEKAQRWLDKANNLSGRGST